MGLPLATLRDKVERAIFRKADLTYGLTYQCYRFCGVSAFRARGVRGLWRYGVRYYVCDDCR